MALDEYRRKRDFTRTPEPSGDGGGPEPGAARFVVQRHRARRPHYDFRLEVDGVLASWAVPKGPTLDPRARRAAFHVEDHPIEYIDFEGVIPSGEYGGGDVIVWDAGTWRPAGDAGDPGRALAGGELHLDMYGEKLRGRFVLVRTGKDGDRGRWLLLHKKDEFSKSGWDPEEHPRSVLSGRTNDEVKADPDRMWRSDQPAVRAAVPLKASAGPAGGDALRELDELPASGGVWRVFGRDLKVTNLDKVLFPGEPPVTKRELLGYTARIAPTVLPYLRRRALRALPRRAPEWLPRWADPGGERTYLVVDEPAALVWAANAGTLEWTVSPSTVDHPERPAWAVIDLEPGGKTSWEDVLALARLHRTALEHLGIRARPKLARRGIQIWVPIARGPDLAATRAWVEKLSGTVAAAMPEVAGAKRPAGEGGLVPYSPWPAPGAPVSAPIDWDELDDPGLRPDAFTIRSTVDRVAEKGDVFRDLLDHRQKLPRLE